MIIVENENSGASMTFKPWQAPRRRSHAKFDIKREAVLNAAAKLFCERGYERTSLSDLAEMLNITKPTVYYYFPSKDDILLAVIRRAQEEAIGFLEKIRYSQATGIEKLRQMLVAYGLLRMSDIGRCLAVIDSAHMEVDSRAEVESRISRAEESIYAVMDQAAKEGSVELKDKTVAYQTLFGSLNWLSRWFNPLGRLSDKSIAELQADILINGLRSQPVKRIPKKAHRAKR